MNLNKIIFSIFILCSLGFSQVAIPYRSNSKGNLKIHHKEILLKDKYNNRKNEQTLNWNLSKTIGSSLMLSCGILYYYFDHQADNNYEKYLDTGNISEMHNYYRKTKKYDKYKRLSWIGIEVGFFINAWSLIKD